MSLISDGRALTEHNNSTESDKMCQVSDGNPQINYIEELLLVYLKGKQKQHYPQSACFSLLPLRFGTLSLHRPAFNTLCAAAIHHRLSNCSDGERVHRHHQRGYLRDHKFNCNEARSLKSINHFPLELVDHKDWTRAFPSPREHFLSGRHEWGLLTVQHLRTIQQRAEVGEHLENSKQKINIARKTASSTHTFLLHQYWHRKLNQYLNILEAGVLFENSLEPHFPENTSGSSKTVYWQNIYPHHHPSSGSWEAGSLPASTILLCFGLYLLCFPKTSTQRAMTR